MEHKPLLSALFLPFVNMLWHIEQGLRNDQPLYGLVPGVLAFLFEQRYDSRLNVIPCKYQMVVGLGCSK